MTGFIDAKNKDNLDAKDNVAPKNHDTASTSNIADDIIEGSMLTEEDQKQVEALCNRINLLDTRLINSYGASAQKGIATFSSSILNRVKARESGSVERILFDLQDAICSTCPEKKKSIFKLFKHSKPQPTHLISKFEAAESRIKEIEHDIQRHQQTLTKDVFVFEQMYDLNLKLCKELTIYILAGRRALARARAEKLGPTKTNPSSNNPMDTQIQRDFENTCARFERKLQDLETSRLISLQMAPQIRLLQQADQEIVDRLRSDIINTIPLWRNQMVMALGIERSRQAFEVQHAATKASHKALQRLNKSVRKGAIALTYDCERSEVDAKSLEIATQEFIHLIDNIARLHEEAKHIRFTAQGELASMELELQSH